MRNLGVCTVCTFRFARFVQPHIQQNDIGFFSKLDCFVGKSLTLFAEAFEAGLESDYVEVLSRHIQCTFRLGWVHVGAACALVTTCTCKVAYQRNRLVDNGQRTVVTQQHRTAFRHTLSKLVVVLVIERMRSKRANVVYQCKQAVNGFVQHRFVDTAAVYSVNDILIGLACGCGHFQFVACNKSVYTVVVSAPVSNYYAGEAPLAAKNFTQQVIVLVSVSAVELVVTAHNRFWVRFGNGNFKCGKVNLAQSAFVHNGIGHHTHVFLVVACKVLQTARNARRLYAVNICSRHFARKKRIFGKILEVTSTFRVALDVCPRGKQHIDVKTDCFFAESLAHFVYKFRIPTVCHGSTTRKTCSRVTRIQSQVVGGSALLT